MNKSPKHNNPKDNKGFTLVELLIYMGLTTLILVVLTSFTVDVTRNAAYAKVTKEVQQNARLMLSQMSQDIRTAKSIQAPVLPDSITIIDTSDNSITYTLSGSQLYVSHGLGAPIQVSNDHVRVSALNFTQVDSAITIDLTVEQVNATARQSEQSSITLQSSVVPRRLLY